MHTVETREYPLREDLFPDRPCDYGECILNITGPAKCTFAMNESNMLPQPYRCKMIDTDYSKGHRFWRGLGSIQEFWIPYLKFDAIKNCFLKNDTTECLQTQSMVEKGYQDALVDNFDYLRKVMRAPTPDEGEVHHAMKGCKNCNDYAHLTRTHTIYCDEPGEPCNDFDGHVKDNLQGNLKDTLDETRNQFYECDDKVDQLKIVLVVTIFICVFITSFVVFVAWTMYKNQEKKKIVPAYVQMTQT